MRAAIYARYSSERQNERSIEDQIALCEERARRESYEVVAIFDDRAMSGASIIGRDGLIDLLAAAKTKAFDIVIVEALDRISRSQRDMIDVHERLRFAGVRLLACDDGEADKLKVGIRGLVSDLYLEDLKHKTRRGMAGKIASGLSAGGRAYGYRPVVGSPGELCIHEDEAGIIRRIFAEFVAGRSPRQIVGGLNADGIPSPRRGLWFASALFGSRARGHGILSNQIYIGRVIWNRVRMVKDPETGKRVSRANPPSEHRSAERPDLAILDRATYDAAQALLQRTRQMPVTERPLPKNRRPLSGLLKCGCCGSGMGMKDRDCGRIRIMCIAAKESRSCKNTKAVYLDTIENIVIGGLRERLSSKAALELYIRTYNEERRRLAADIVNQRDKLERRKADNDRAISRVQDMIIAGILSIEEGAAKIAPLRVEQGEVAAALKASAEPPTVVRLHPGIAADFKRRLDSLADVVASGSAFGGESIAALRSMIDRVVITPDADGMRVDVEGSLRDLIGPANAPHSPGSSLVAGEGFCPTPRNSAMDVPLAFFAIAARKRAG